MNLSFTLGKTLFLLALIANAYLIILDPTFKHDFEAKFKSLPDIFTSLSFLSHLIDYIYHIRLAFGLIQLLGFFLLGYQSCIIWMLNVIVLILQTLITNLPRLFTNKKEDKMEAIPNILHSLIILSGFLFIASAYECKCCKNVQQQKEKEKSE